MILVGNTRGHGANLAAHLLSHENDHVEVHEVRGFASTDLHGAFVEAEAISSLTKAKHPLFSLSLSPPTEAFVSNDDFENAIDRAEDVLGLKDQPRAIVFHEKESVDGISRRHAHAVWMRINGETLKAIPHPFSKLRLNELSKELFLENAWDLPQGYLQKAEKDPNAFDFSQAQQAKRSNHSAGKLKAALKNAWAQSDDLQSLREQLGPLGFDVAKGDRRGFVFVDKGKVTYSVSRWIGEPASQVRKRLGSPGTLRGIEETRQRLKERSAAPNISCIQTAQIRDEQRFRDRRAHVVRHQRQERLGVQKRHETERAVALQANNQPRAKGLRALFNWLSGSKRQHAKKELAALQSDQREHLKEVIIRQLKERQRLHQERRNVRKQSVKPACRRHRAVAQRYMDRYSDRGLR